jgi:hypothetical protein
MLALLGASPFCQMRRSAPLQATMAYCETADGTWRASAYVLLEATGHDVALGLA